MLLQGGTKAGSMTGRLRDAAGEAGSKGAALAMTGPGDVVSADSVSLSVVIDRQTEEELSEAHVQTCTYAPPSAQRAPKCLSRGRDFFAWPIILMHSALQFPHGGAP